ncbi:hypothetical protein FJZ40_00455 [Candidatus Shapirobacteria bacterium]|nr:hypothetical protein [Candidatus Shapirobacteria bacterium]
MTNRKLKRRLVRIVLVLLTVSLFQGFFLIKPLNTVESLSSVKDTLSNSRLSYFARVSGTIATGATSITIKTTDSPPDANTSHLFPGDTVKIGPASNTTRTVGAILNSTSFDITSGLATGVVVTDPIIATQSATHTVSLTNAGELTNGAVRVSIPSASSGYNDGLPDQTGFDMGAVTASDVTCPTGGGVTSWESATATAAASFNTFECRFNGTLSASQALTFTIGGTNKLINPAPASGHVQGTADTYGTKVELLDYTTGYTVVETATVKTAMIESVLVTVTVPMSITFTVAGLGLSSYCGQTTDVTTTFSSIPFGSVSLTTFYEGAQRLTVSTNSPTGYSVTLEEDNQLGKDGGTTTEIPDTSCGASACTHTTAAEWNSTVYDGLGYSLDGTDAAFQHDDSGRSFNAKQIACTSAAGTCGTQDTSQTIMSKNSPVSSDIVDVCFRLNVSGTQTAGAYRNKVMYIATPLF